MSLIDLVRRTIRTHDLAGRGTRVVVALSGGSDSVALAHLVRELDVAGDLTAAGAAHFNHQLRPAADRDEQFCAGIARDFGWPFIVDRADVAAIAVRERRSIEDAARTARHAFFERARVQLGADAMALGHTRDDQAETFLLRLVRGAGARGLAAMHPRNGAVIRPLLACRRGDLRAYLADRGAAHVEDESNADVGIPRNRVRAELIPLLRERFNPAIVDALADQAELARDEWAWMETEANRIAAGASASGEAVELDRAALLAAPRALRRLALWRAMTAAARRRTIGFDHVEAVLMLLDSETAGAGIDAPGQRVDLLGSRVVLTSRSAGAAGRPTPKTPNSFRYPLSIPGEVRLADAGLVLSAENGPAGTAAGGRNPAVAIVRSDVCRGPLAVRNRRPGDRFHPVGLGGRQKKLQDFFVDQKVARGRRDAVPLVVDGADRIVWVAGHGIDAEFRVTEPTQAVLVLRLRQV